VGSGVLGGDAGRIKVLRPVGERASGGGILPGRQIRTVFAQSVENMNLPGWDLHPLQGDQKGHWSVSVNGNWRMTFTFEGQDAILVNYQDYH